MFLFWRIHKSSVFFAKQWWVAWVIDKKSIGPVSSENVPKRKLYTKPVMVNTYVRVCKEHVYTIITKRP